MPQLSGGNLVGLDAGQIVMPPAGMEIGYVPVVSRQELDDGAVSIGSEYTKKSIATAKSITMSHFPQSGRLLFNTDSYSSDNLTIKIFNAKGQNISSTQLSNLNNSVDVSHITSGVYIVSVLQNGSWVKTEKFVKR